jgi:hypothetical protein
MGEHHYEDERPSQLRVRTPALPQGVDPYSHSLQEALWPYELRTNEDRRMWLPRPAEVLGNGSLAGDLVNLFAQLKRRVKRALAGGEGADA